MKGEVRVQMRVLRPEKLLERAMDMGIVFSRVATRDDHTLTVEVSDRDARRLLRLCRRFSIPARVLSHRGGSAFRRWLRRRWTLPVGLAAGLALCWLCLGRVWFIDIRFTGDAADRGDATALRTLLAEKGVAPGASRRIDTHRLADELLSECDGMSYIGVNLQGVRLSVEAVPELEAPELYDVNEPRNLYAGLGGIVLSVNAEAGEPCVKPGDTVRRGQLLIRGAERATREGDRPIGALGEVVIRAWFEGHAEGRLRQAQTQYTGRQSVSSTLVTPWFRFPVVAGERFERQSEEISDLPLGGLYIPVKLERVAARETRMVVERGDRELLSSRLVALAIADARTALTQRGPERYKLARSWIRYTQREDDILRANVVCEIYTNTAVPWEALHQGG